jgi:hypothetical protein
MSTPDLGDATDRRWLNWGEQIITADSAGSEPSESPEPGFDGFEGGPSANSSDIGSQMKIRAPLPVLSESRPERVGLQVDCGLADEGVMSWAAWRAAALNCLFLDLGRTGQPGQITADTIRHGERARPVGTADEPISGKPRMIRP